MYSASVFLRVKNIWSFWVCEVFAIVVQGANLRTAVLLKTEFRHHGNCEVFVKHRVGVRKVFANAGCATALLLYSRHSGTMVFRRCLASCKSTVHAFARTARILAARKRGTTVLASFLQETLFAMVSQAPLSSHAAKTQPRRAQGRPEQTTPPRNSSKSLQNAFKNASTSSKMTLRCLRQPCKPSPQVSRARASVRKWREPQTVMWGQTVPLLRPSPAEASFLQISKHCGS